MKLLIMIVNEEYQNRVSSVFQKENCSATMIASTGGFLQYGSTIFLLGVEQVKATQLVDALKEEIGLEFVDDKQTLSSQNIEKSARVMIFYLDIVEYLKVMGGSEDHDKCKTEGTTIYLKGSREELG